MKILGAALDLRAALCGRVLYDGLFLGEFGDLDFDHHRSINSNCDQIAQSARALITDLMPHSQIHPAAGFGDGCGLRGR